MAQIREYNSQVSLQGEVGGRRATGGDFGAQVGEAEQNLSQSMDNTVNYAEQLEAEKDRVWRANAVSNYQLSQMDAMQQAKTDPEFAKKYGADASGFSDAFGEHLTQSTGIVTADAPSPRSARLLQEELAGVNENLMVHAKAYQAEQGGKYVKDQVDQMMQTDAKIVMQDPTQASAVLDRGKVSLAQLPYLEPDEHAALLKTYQQNIALAAGKSMTLHAPEAVLQSIAPDVMADFKPTPRVLAAQGNAPVTNFSNARVSETVQNYSPLITQAAANHGVDPNFIKAQIQAESGGNANAINNADVKVTGSPSVGIAQFQPETAAQYGVTNPKDPNQAIPGMAAYMGDLLKQFGGDYRKAAAAYNWGPGNLTEAISKYGDQWSNHIPASTQNYINKIFETAPPVATASQSLQDIQQKQATAEPSRASTNPDWFNQLNWEQQFQIINDAEQGVRANQTRDSQNLAFAKQQREAQQQVIMNDMFNRIGMTENTAQNPTGKALTVDEVRTSDLDYQNKEHMLSAINAVSRGEMATDPEVFNTLFQRVHLPPGDPNRLSDDADLLPYVGKGLSMESLNQLRGELRGKNTPDGANLSDMKKNFFTMAKGQIDSSSFITNDPIGKAKFYGFQTAVLSKIDAVQRSGGDVNELFDPASKNYLGKLIQNYQRSPQQQIQDYSNYMSNTAAATNPATPTAPAAVARLPGESPSEYLKRISGNK